MQQTLQRISISFGLIAAAILIYAAILQTSPERYSIFKLLRGEPAPADQRIDGAKTAESLSGPRLTRETVPGLAQLNDEYSRLIELVEPAVVSIDTRAEEQVEVRGQKEVTGIIRGPDGEERKVPVLIPQVLDRFWEFLPGVGSGVFITEQGQIITNHHVVIDADDISIRTHDDEVYKAELIGADSTVDLAVLRIKNANGRKFPVLNFADSNEVRPGEMVVAVGTPFGFSDSVTQGIISGTGRRFGTNLAADYFQTDAVINPGSSGGPLMNIFGEVVGINTIVYSGKPDEQVWQGIGLSLPSNRVIKSYEDIMGLGHRMRPYMGVMFNDLSEEKAREAGLKERGGALIASVIPGSPAHEAGLEGGDIVLKMGDQEIDTASEAAREIQQQDPGQPIEIKIRRNGETKDITMRLDEISDVNQIAFLPSELKSLSNPRDLKSALGIKLKELSSEARLAIGLPSDFGGILVESLSEDSSLAAHLRPRDLIHEINGRQIRTEEEFYEALTQLPVDKSSTMVLTRNGRRYYLEMRP